MTTTLNRANRELFRRGPDEAFATLKDLHDHCRQERQYSTDVWQPPHRLQPQVSDGELRLTLDTGESAGLNDWSFSQVCRLAGVSKETINRVQPETAMMAFRDTLPYADKPVQLLTTGQTVRSVHGVSYTRLWNSELIETIRDVATDFTPPQTAINGGTGLYCGEQDMFCFLIDPTGWIDIGGEAFAPGFFVWNSEVGRRSLGMQTFWFQKVCANHIVWDAVEVVEFSRKHTANVRDGLLEIRRHDHHPALQGRRRLERFHELWPRRPPLVAKVCNQAHTWIFEQAAERSNGNGHHENGDHEGDGHY